MKLVEILAKELIEWKEDAHIAMQDNDSDKTIWFLEKDHEFVAHDGFEWKCDSYFKIMISRPSCLATDYKDAIVTKDQWQAERDRQKGGEWKRHRGGKRPVADDVVVEYKLRDGSKFSRLAGCLEWSHDNSKGDIMQYRVIIQPQAEEPTANVFTGKDAGVEYAFGEPGCDMSKLDWKPLGNAKTGDIEFYSVKAGEAEVNKFCMGKNCNATSKNILHSSECEAEHEASYTGAWAQSSGPLTWRDTIIHCQAIIEDCEREIERNVELLDAEGLMIQTNTKTAMQHYETAVDMSDWRNWKEGDIVEVVIDNDRDLPIGKQYPVSQIEKPGYKGGMPVMIKDEDDCEHWPEDSKYDLRPVFKFVSRP